jgi:hypothetical protein
MDATGSMSSLLTNAKNKVCQMFERAIEVLRESNLPPDSFELEFAVYRDYDSYENVLQVSGWETRPLNLRKFMDTVAPIGGGDYEEAIEIGLWHVNEQTQMSDLSQVILIGDAPAKSEQQIEEYRQTYGGEDFWASTKFKEITNYKKELAKIKAKDIPVHAFYVSKYPRCVENFTKIAKETGGKCEFLDVNSSSGADRLTDLVTTFILQDIGRINEIGDQLVETYDRKYPKSYK